MSKRAQLTAWAESLTVDQMRALLVELIEDAIVSETVRVGDLAPYWEATGEPLVEGQRTWNDD